MTAAALCLKIYHSPPFVKLTQYCINIGIFLHMAFLKITQKEGSLEIALLTTPD